MSILSKLKFRIGTKLAISAGIGIALVCGMLANQILGNASVGASNEVALNQRLITQDAIE